MVIPATQLRVGMVILYNNELYRVTNVVHITPGNWRGMVQTKLRSVRTGNSTENRFRSEDKVERVTLLNELYGMIRRRLEAFTALPFGSLDKMALKARLDELGDSARMAR